MQTADFRLGSTKLYRTQKNGQLEYLIKDMVIKHGVNKLTFQRQLNARNTPLRVGLDQSGNSKYAKVTSEQYFI